jgi:ABC-2 type transport system permease protein
MFGAAVILLTGIRGGEFGQAAGLVMMVGWLTGMVAADCMAELPLGVSEEAKTGTLEQLCIAPVSLSRILFICSLADFLGIGVREAIAALIPSFMVAPVSSVPVILLLFFLSLVGAYGMGFAFAGLALIYKRIKSVTNLVFSLMIFFTGALVGLESTGWAFEVLKIAFPLTWGISLMRQVVEGSVTLTTLLQNGNMVGLILHSAAYLGFGLAIFALGYKKARFRGTLSHY